MSKAKEADVLHLLDDSARRKRHDSRISVLWLLLVVGVILCFGSFILWYRHPRTFYFFHILDDNEDNRFTCSGIPNVEKLDCFPDYPVTEKACLARGCCYQAVTPKNSNLSVNPLGVPYCYYPADYNGYSIYSMSVDGRHINLKLKRNFPSGFPKDVPDITLAVSVIADNIVRIKITDSNAERFEVPIPINDGIKNLDTSSYHVDIDSRSNLYITRKSSGAVIFNTTLSRLVYSDQFLQISSRLPSPYLYGIGEKYGPLLRDMNWTRITLFNSDQEPIPNYPLYGSQPFYMLLEPNGDANGVFLLNSNAMDVILQPTPAITFRPIGGVLDFYIMLGPTPADVVQQYTSLIGRTFMPPYWSLGFHLCRYGYNSLNTTRETLQRNIDAGIPIDVQWNDIDYMDRYKDFTYDKDKFAELPKFVDDLHKNKGMHYVLMTDPGISNSEAPGSYPPYDEGVTDDIFMKNPNGSLFVGKVWTDGTCVFPDFSHPNTTAYWSRQFERFHKDIQFDGVWIDMNEPSNFVDGGIDGCINSPFEDPQYVPGASGVKLRHKTACMTAKHYKTIHYNEHNLLGYREGAATSQSLKKLRNKRPFVISRATFLGHGVHSGHWSGDIASTWEDMRYTIPSTINFNMYGVSMVGSDICGFNQNTTVELCARWQALGAFYPFSRNHNERVTIEQDPAALGPTVVEATKKALTMRYWILPYLYTLFYRSHVFGETVVRPLLFEFPEDKATYSIDEQFMWGSGLMIIPTLYPNANSVTAYLPKGLWYYAPVNAAPAVINSNGGHYVFSSDITTIVTSLRGGYIIPGQIASQTTTQSRQNAFGLVASLDEKKEAKGELYWDDGDSLDSYENGEYNLIQFSVAKSVFKSEIKHQNYSGGMDVAYIQIMGVDKLPTNVTLNGINCQKRVTGSFEESSTWFFKHFKKTDQYLETCVFGALPPLSFSVGLKPTSLLTTITLNWS